MRRRSRQRGGWFMIDTITALIIVAILLATLAAATARHRRTSDRLAQSRDAVRLAEQTLTALQTGQPAPAAPAGVIIRVRKLDTPTNSPAVVWAEVTVMRGSQSNELIGMARAGAIAGGGS